MSFGGRHTKLIAGGLFNFSQGMAAGDQVSLAGVFPAGFTLVQVIPLMWAKISFLSLSIGDVPRTISIFGESLGSISSWPANLAPNQYVQYRFPSAQAAAAYWLPIVNPLPSAIFSFSALGSHTLDFTAVGYYEIFANGTPIT